MWMRCIACLLVAGLLCACQSTQSSDQNPPDAIGGHYLLSGDVPQPGRHALHPGDTVSTVLAGQFHPSHRGPLTLVLIRRSPEGKTRQLIQLNSDGKLMDEKQNFVLRVGDELVFPSAH